MISTMAIRNCKLFAVLICADALASLAPVQTSQPFVTVRSYDLSVDVPGTTAKGLVTSPFDFRAFAVSWHPAQLTAPPIVEVCFSRDGLYWTEWTALALELQDGDNQPLCYSQLLTLDEPYAYATYQIVQTTATGVLKFRCIDSGVTPQERLASISAAKGTIEEPSVISRDQWGCPDGEGSPGWQPEYTTVSILVIHHTATSNTSSDWAAIVRSIWDYHTYSNGWGDIGYNYLIDPNGTLYEGRAGGEDVIGAHFSCRNANTMGIAMLGTYTSATPTPEALVTLESLLAWEAKQRDINPLGSSYHSGTELTLNAICGHRDANAAYPTNACSTTVCPGDVLYGLLPSIRVDVRELLDVFLDPPSIGVSTSSFNVSCNEGSDASGQILSVFNTRGGTLVFTIVSNASWLIVNPAAGTSGGTDDQSSIYLSFATSTLNAGSYTGALTISAPGATNDGRVVLVSITVSTLYDGRQYGDLDNNKMIDLLDFNLLVNGWASTYTIVDFNNLVNHWMQTIQVK